MDLANWFGFNYEFDLTSGPVSWSLCPKWFWLWKVVEKSRSKRAQTWTFWLKINWSALLVPKLNGSNLIKMAQTLRICRPVWLDLKKKLKTWSDSSLHAKPFFFKEFNPIGCLGGFKWTQLFFQKLRNNQRHYL